MVEKKNDFLDNKLRWDLLPLQEVEDIVEVYTKGAKKYGENKWQHLENGIERYKGALLRHLVLFDKGETVDQETGCKHLAQVAWNAIAMLHLSKNKKDTKSIIDKLDKKIEEKINNCNKILDDITCLYSSKELENRDNIGKSTSIYSHNSSYIDHLKQLEEDCKKYKTITVSNIKLNKNESLIPEYNELNDTEVRYTVTYQNVGGSIGKFSEIRSHCMSRKEATVFINKLQKYK